MLIGRNARVATAGTTKKIPDILVYMVNAASPSLNQLSIPVQDADREQMKAHTNIHTCLENANSQQRLEAPRGLEHTQGHQPLLHHLFQHLIAKLSYLMVRIWEQEMKQGQ